MGESDHEGDNEDNHSKRQKNRAFKEDIPNNSVRSQGNFFFRRLQHHHNKHQHSQYSCFHISKIKYHIQ